MGDHLGFIPSFVQNTYECEGGPSEISALMSSQVGEVEGHLLISIMWRFPKPTNPCRNLKIFMEENLLKKIVMAAPSVAPFPKH